MYGPQPKPPPVPTVDDREPPLLCYECDDPIDAHVKMDGENICTVCHECDNPAKSGYRKGGVARDPLPSRYMGKSDDEDIDEYLAWWNSHAKNFD